MLHYCGLNSPWFVTESYVVAGFSFMLALITIPGNLLVCLAVAKASNKNIRNPFNYFVLSLAMADLVVGSVTEPMFIYINMKEVLTGSPSGSIEDTFLNLSYFISCTTSVLSICLLGIERYLAILSPLKFRLLFSVKRFLSLATIVWVASIGLSSIYLFTTYEIYAVVFITNAVAWTLTVSIFTYVKILRKFRERMRNTAPTLNASRTTPRPPNPWSLQLTKTYMIIISIFLACYIPAAGAIYAMNWCKSCSCTTTKFLRDLQYMIVAVNSALNPFIYAFRFKRFRRAVSQMLFCTPGPSTAHPQRATTSRFVSTTTTMSRSAVSISYST